MDASALRLLKCTLPSIAAAFAMAACNSNPQVTSVGKSVTTLEKFTGIANCGSTAPPAPDPQAWWNGMPAANHGFPFAGWETFRNVTGGCAQTRVDVYRAVVTFNLASVTGLKGLVQKAELVVSTHALPAAAGPGGAVTVGPFGQPGSITLFCPAQIGGAGSLVRFGPASAVPATSAAGSLEMLGANPFPMGTSTVYTLPTSFAVGAIAGASSPTTMAPSGVGTATITTDVSGAVTAALNAGAAGLSWMLTSNFEGPLPGQLPAAGTVDCRTSYDFDLRITHF
jgi:hypothetical protein